MQLSQSLVTLAALSLSVITINSQTADAAEFQGLGYVPGFDGSSTAKDMSASGSIVVGTSRAPNSGASTSFLWTKKSGLRRIPVNNFVVDAVSNNGRVVVGFGNDQILRWGRSEGLTVLGQTAGNSGPEGLADGVSADGSTVVGYTGDGAETDAFRWTAAEGLVDLDFSDPAQGFFQLSGATGVSANGSVIVGFSGDSQTGALVPLRWTQSTGLMRLGIDGDTSIFGAATAISANGRLTVGLAGSASVDPDGQAFLWAGQRSLGLGDLQNGTGISMAYDLSDSGSVADTVIVGSSTSNAGQPFGSSIIFGDEPQEAFIWTFQDGMRSLKTVLVDDYGLDLTGWILLEARSVSADGVTIVGTGINPQGKQEAWLATLD